jgi:hypothetical protein
MADRGKPLAFAKREEIQSRRPAEPLRKVAAQVGVAVNTVRKYERKFDTKP